MNIAFDSQEPITVDGGQGEGGGQVVRTSLTLSMVTGRPLELINIRANRNPSGLKRQHLTCVQAAAAISQAETNDVRVGSSELQFTPGPIKSGDYRFDIGTAGSTTLVAQTIALPLSMTHAPSRVSIRGGTYNTMAPPFDFFQTSYLPLLRKMGFGIHAQMASPGFYPKGGGELDLRIQPFVNLKTLALPRKAEWQKKAVHCILGNLPKHIAETEIATFTRKLGWGKKHARTTTFHDCLSPGNVLMAELKSEELTEVITEFGKQGLPAEKVAAKLARTTKSFLESGHVVGPHLADQLLLPMAMVVGNHDETSNQGLKTCSFWTGPLTEHATTHIKLLEQFLPLQVQIKEHDQGTVELTLSPAPQ